MCWPDPERAESTGFRGVLCLKYYGLTISASGIGGLEADRRGGGKTTRRGRAEGRLKEEHTLTCI